MGGGVDVASKMQKVIPWQVVSPVPHGLVESRLFVSTSGVFNVSDLN